MSNHIVKPDILARFHTATNQTGLNIYNPYFKAVGMNACYELHVAKDIALLLERMKQQPFVGAVTAGFEKDPRLVELVDTQSEASRAAGRIGFITHRSGSIHAHYHPGEGLLNAINEVDDIGGKEIVIVGAGSVVRALLCALRAHTKQPKLITIVNRSPAHAEECAAFADCRIATAPLDKLADQEGDILINASRIGSTVLDTIYSAAVVEAFNAVVDVTFGNPNTQLIKHAQQANKHIANGWDVFAHQVAVVIRDTFEVSVDMGQLKPLVVAGLKRVNHGAKLREAT